MLKNRLYQFWLFIKVLLKVNVRLIRGTWKITALPQPAITIFGGSRLTLESEHAQRACALATKLAEKGFSIITGGGPGIMEAANLGAYQQIKRCQNGEKCEFITGSLGIGLTYLNRDKPNPYLQDFIVMDHFFERKWLLVKSSVGFVVFPGGYGTLDELFEILTLIQCGRMPIMPVVLMGVEYWKPIVEFFQQRVLADGLITIHDLELFTITDDVQQAFENIKFGYDRYLEHKEFRR